MSTFFQITSKSVSRRALTYFSNTHTQQPSCNIQLHASAVMPPMNCQCLINIGQAPFIQRDDPGRGSSRGMATSRFGSAPWWCLLVAIGRDCFCLNVSSWTWPGGFVRLMSFCGWVMGGDSARLLIMHSSLSGAVMRFGNWNRTSGVVEVFEFVRFSIQ